MTLEDAVEITVERAKQEGILVDFLNRYGTEVTGMLRGITVEEYGEVMKKEGFEEGDVYLKITASRTGKIRVEANSNSIQLCDKNKSPVSEFTESKRNASITAEYKVMKNQTYYIRQRITDIREPGGINDTITGNSIRYNYVED